MTVAEFNKCVDDYADGLFRFVVFHLRNEEDARDVVQDAFEKMWRLREGVDGQKSKSYLFTAAYHLLINSSRRRKNTVDVSLVGEIELAHSEQYSDAQEVLKCAVQRLPSVQQSVILLRDYEGYSYREIGEITGLSEAQVKVYIYRGRAALKEFLVSPDLIR
jgi:RNA polymerase sigma-70 factor (ECF subfamily)